MLKWGGFERSVKNGLRGFAVPVQLRELRAPQFYRKLTMFQLQLRAENQSSCRGERVNKVLNCGLARTRIRRAVSVSGQIRCEIFRRKNKDGKFSFVCCIVKYFMSLKWFWKSRCNMCEIVCRYAARINRSRFSLFVEPASMFNGAYRTWTTNRRWLSHLSNKTQKYNFPAKPQQFRFTHAAFKSTISLPIAAPTVFQCGNSKKRRRRSRNLENKTRKKFGPLSFIN